LDVTRGVKAYERVWERTFGWKRRKEARATLLRFAQELQEVRRVLDVGSGRGYAAEVIEEEWGCEVVCCDVVLATNDTDEFVIFDGERLPFADRSFDAVLMTFVLHHAQAPDQLLKEARRVSRQVVLIVEDTPRSWVDEAWGSWHTRSFKRRTGLDWEGRIRRAEEWKAVFGRAGLHVKRAHRLRRWERVPPVARTAFVLEPR